MEQLTKFSPSISYQLIHNVPLIIYPLGPCKKINNIFKLKHMLIYRVLEGFNYCQVYKN